MKKPPAGLALGPSRLWDINRHQEDIDRARGRMRARVVEMLRENQKLPTNDQVDPSPADVAAALREPSPDPIKVMHIPLTDAEWEELRTDPPIDMATWVRTRISDDRRNEALRQAQQQIADDTATLNHYVASRYVKGRARRPGSKLPARTFQEDMQIAEEYFAALADHDAAKAADSRHRETLDAVKRRIAEKHGFGIRTLEAIIRDVKPQRKN